VAAALAATADGRPGLVVVTGESGIGKSRLVAEALNGAPTAGWRVLAGSCLDIGDGGLPYLPLAEILRTLVRTTPPDELESLAGISRTDLADVFPELGVPAATAAPGTTLPVGPGLNQARLFERVLQLIGRLAADRPTAIVVEDVQWIDRATRDLLTFLVRNLASERVLVVLTCRTEGLARGHPILAWLAELGRSQSTVRIDLARLHRDDVVRQLARLAGRTPSPELADRIWRRSEGNPMFVEELFATSGDGSGDEPPGTLVEILLGRVAGLPPESRPVLAGLAVAGRPTDESLLAEVLGLTSEALMAGLRPAIERGLVIHDPIDGRHRFGHELLREVVEGELMAGERRGLHERFATVLSAQPDRAEPAPAGGPAELAHHWLAAGRTLEAYGASLAAGSAAEAVFAHVDAHRHYERAIELEGRLVADERPSADDVLGLRRRTADAADFAGDLGRAVELTREAITLVDRRADPMTAAFLHGRLGYVLWASGHGDAALREHATAVDLVPPEPPTPVRARVLAGYAGALMGAARWAEARQAADEAAQVAVAVGAPGEEARARNVLGSVLVALGDLEGGVEQLRRARDLAERLGGPDALVVALHNLALHLLQADRFDEGLIEARMGLEVARRTGLERRFGMDLAALAGQILLRLGRWEEADATTREALAIDPAGSGSVYLETVRARVTALQGDPAGALQRLAALEAAGFDPDVAAELSAARAEAAILAGRPEMAADAVGDGLGAMAGLDDVLWTIPLLGLGMRAAADLAERATAIRSEAGLRTAGELARTLRDALASVGSRPVSRTAIAWQAEAAASETRLRSSPDPAAWHAVAAAWEAVPDAYRVAEARFREAEAILVRDGTRGAAGPALRQAHSGALALGARVLSDAVEALAARARVALPPPAAVVEPTTSEPDVESPDATITPAGGAAVDDGKRLREVLGLSSREMEVLALVAAGLSNGEIAARLFITRKTAAVHVTHILDKLGVGNRVEAAVVAERAGLRN
jgi:DNA-binding NarL/FixJ family response regulator